MTFESLCIPDVILIYHAIHKDERGHFMELFRQREFVKYCGDYTFVQDNISHSRQGTLRGLHYQIAQPQGKLVQVISGSVFDVVVDLRKESRTYGAWAGQHLGSDKPMSLWVPPGFAHGFYVQSEQAVVLYKCTDYYSPDNERILNWADPVLNIDWPIMKNAPLFISEKDRQAPFINSLN
ncbi:dTDP-4-dehydrorhamnose 3,5-epimerase [Aeromonas hydrophila]|uniref:dTDP-4-dehydrorhamnose 3,5-epimerase n=1 Tax=Aeromonas hydrophila TaxID=644 RepID=UPI00188E120F|nr:MULTISPECIES: dTDP-4-dehydrorhamnose 3,5-epimerase [Aeromonas]MBF4799179.1 dTDP-4-dehydrorhamnose 3,5-epimerase [Aeromonas hydrophila]MCV3275816.1 dTDP-4-dehydrorhamnose 3,5-epimerase [Aeromonas hydrophila]MDF5705414.1 dTDP-4-dehydrorhamnose 3,5-epimerase [Aeromonas hydrophila subsp. hydrophila]WAF96580.1 dTDP-4-dehydrorhamnose 3,5-epimerase [Aeromonas sp. BC14]HDX8357012.1 dTDP-4-dehydrorhamnose 3,5-epimerase [Aeromonas hydrophila]